MSPLAGVFANTLIYPQRLTLKPRPYTLHPTPYSL
eukprot:CAMPEP_0198689532 /NCGR_PEP_ID=MMETSP1468-20131203/144535_1 /TAXON_ID=1461545 /ORGANISM="Mantoniella sp, Strain CCMP1436" /LENGTH=34 /DNA_ID= /DNA_START= /DNA_END= /DNA_ORIENTATION=